MYYEISCFRKLLAGLLIDVGYKKFATALFAIEKRLNGMQKVGLFNVYIVHTKAVARTEFSRFRGRRNRGCQGGGASTGRFTSDLGGILEETVSNKGRIDFPNLISE